MDRLPLLKRTWFQSPRKRTDYCSSDATTFRRGDLVASPLATNSSLVQRLGWSGWNGFLQRFRITINPSTFYTILTSEKHLVKHNLILDSSMVEHPTVNRTVLGSSPSRGVR
jgi:hypothetical protein